MKTLTKTTSIIFMGLGLCACSASTPEVAQNEELSKPHSSHHHSHHHATVKPGASVSLESIKPVSMSSGVYQTVRLKLKDNYDDGVLDVSIGPSEGLSVFGGVSSKTFDMSQSDPHIWDVDVKADADGVYFLNVFSQAIGQSRSFSVRLDMGEVTQEMFEKAMPADGELVDGGKIRVLNAQETIR